MFYLYKLSTYVQQQNFLKSFYYTNLIKIPFSVKFIIEVQGAIVWCSGTFKLKQERKAEGSSTVSTCALMQKNFNFSFSFSLQDAVVGNMGRFFYWYGKTISKYPAIFITISIVITGLAGYVLFKHFYVTRILRQTDFVTWRMPM